jgi:hypothetical protein
MSKGKTSTFQRGEIPLSIEQLEAGLRIMSEEETDLNAFWDENIVPFRQTVLFAIRETSNALLSPKVPVGWRAELESQLEDLVQYIKLADRYIARRFNSAEQVRALPGSFPRIH